MKRLFLSILTMSLLFLLSSPSQALPKYSSTTLPIPANMLDEEKDLLNAILQLQVYQDSEDPNQYYYIPPFHVRQYKEGAASAVLNPVLLKNYADIERKKREKEAYSNIELARLSEAYDKSKDELKNARIYLAQAALTGNGRVIAIWQKMVDEQQLEFDLALKDLGEARDIYQKKGTIMSEGMCLEIDRQIISYIRMSNIQVEFNESSSFEERARQLNIATGELSNAYGGYLGINTYAGFTKSQLTALRTYMRKYAPHVKVSLMPVEKINFGSLLSFDVKDKDNAKGLKMFTRIEGSGDYLGAAIILDTSVAAATGVAQHLGPFILPIKIEAQLKQQMEPFEARLDCDFSAGYSVKGRADVRDGLVIYDNDITNQIKAADNSTGACNVIHIKGDKASAEYKALKELEKQYDDIQITRTNLANSEKEKYYAGVLADIQKNRRPAKNYSPISNIFFQAGWGGVVLEGLSRAADFHWHTNIQDIENISKIKFSKIIKSNGHETIIKPVGVNICLIFNPDQNGYDRCTDSEENQSQDMKVAIDEIAVSEECAEHPEPAECSKRRIAAGKLPTKIIRSNAGDTIVAGAI